MNSKTSNSLIITGISLIFIFYSFCLFLLVGYYLYDQITNDLAQMEKERVTISSQATEDLINKYGKTY